MNKENDDSSLGRLADFTKACVATTAEDEEDCMRDQFVILGSSTHHQQHHQHRHYEEEEEEEEGNVVNYDDEILDTSHHRYILGDMSPKGIVFLIVLAVSLGVCAFFVYKFHHIHHINNSSHDKDHAHQQVEQAAATETTTTETTVASAASTGLTVESAETKKKTNKNKKEESTSSPLQQQQQQEQDKTDDDEEPDLVVEEDLSSKNNNSKSSAARRRSKRIQERQPQQQQNQPVMAVVVGVSRTTVPTSSQLTAAVARSGDLAHVDEITLKAAEKVLTMRKHLEERTGETLSLDKVFEQSLDQSRHEEKMRYKEQAELRHYKFEINREQFKNETTQSRHDETMAVQNQDNAWLAKIKACRCELLQTLMHEFLYTVYAFFAAHVVWHFFRLRQIWTLAGILSALHFSVCGQCTPDDLFAFQYYEAPPPLSPSYFSSSTSGYFSSYFPSSSSLSSWSTFSILEFVAPAWLLQDLQCTGICGVKIILGVFGMIVTFVIVPAWMAKYMAGGVIAITMLSNVFEWVPFMFGWEYMAGIYCCLGLGCYYYVEHVCNKSQCVLQQATGGTPSKKQVTAEEVKLENVKKALQKHKFVLVGLAFVCFHYSALELERNHHQFA